MPRIVIQSLLPEGGIRDDIVVATCDGFSRHGLLNIVYKHLNRECKEKRSVTRALPAPGVLSPPTKGPKRVVYERIITVGAAPMGRSGSTNITRPQTVSVPGLSTWQHTDSNDSSSIQPGSTVAWVNGRSGTKNQSWKSQVRNGVNATTSMTASEGSISFSPRNAVVTWQGPQDKSTQVQGFSGYIVGYPPAAAAVPPLLKSAVDNGLASKTMDGIYSIEHDADIGESLAEYRQSLHMIGSPLKGMHDLLGIYQHRAAEVIRNAQRRYGKSLSRYDKRDLIEVQAALGKLWLEFKFGWNPLAQDVMAAFKAIDSARSGVKSKQVHSFRNSSVSADSTVWGKLGHIAFGTHHTSKVTYIAKNLVGIKAKQVRTLPYVERLGLIPEKFVPTVYAIIPYSWLVDYFTGLGTAIESVGSDMHLVAWMCRVEVTLSEVTYTDIPNRAVTASSLGGVMQSYSFTPGVSRTTHKQVNRFIPSSIAAPPTLKVPSSWKPYANIAALVASRRIPSIGALVGTFTP